MHFAGTDQGAVIEANRSELIQTAGEKPAVFSLIGKSSGFLMRKALRGEYHFRYLRQAEEWGILLLITPRRGWPPPLQVGEKQVFSGGVQSPSEYASGGSQARSAE